MGHHSSNTNWSFKEKWSPSNQYLHICGNWRNRQLSYFSYPFPIGTISNVVYVHIPARKNRNGIYLSSQLQIFWRLQLRGCDSVSVEVHRNKHMPPKSLIPVLSAKKSMERLHRSLNAWHLSLRVTQCVAILGASIGNLSTAKFCMQTMRNI